MDLFILPHGVSTSNLLYCLFVFGEFLKGVTAEIQTQPKVLAAAGGDAHLSCQLLETKEVLQVTWQKILKDEDKNIGSYDPHFNETVNPDFVGKVQFIEAGLQKNSIVIRNVTEEDEGCYYCLFNTYTDGSLRGQTCLHVYELHEPVLHVREASSPEESVVSCSATGGPAPTVTLTVPQQHLHFSQYNTTRVTNTNNTVTVITTAVLSGLHDDSTQVRCAARVDSGPQMEVVKRISEFKQTSDDGLKEKSGSDQERNGFGIIVSVCLLFAAIIVFFYRKKTQNSKSEMDEIPETSTTNTHTIGDSSVTSENSGVRKRTPPEEHKQNNKQDKLSEVSTKLDFEQREDFDKTK